MAGENSDSAKCTSRGESSRASPSERLTEAVAEGLLLLPPFCSFFSCSLYWKRLGETNQKRKYRAEWQVRALLTFQLPTLLFSPLPLLLHAPLPFPVQKVRGAEPDAIPSKREATFGVLPQTLGGLGLALWGSFCLSYMPDREFLGYRAGIWGQHCWAAAKDPGLSEWPTVYP